MPKSYRLHGLFRNVPVLRNKHFVLLDNDSQHIATCETTLYLDAVKATTDEESVDFYDRVIELMQLARKEGANVSPANAVYNYPTKILKALAENCEAEKVLTPGAAG